MAAERDGNYDEFPAAPSEVETEVSAVRDIPNQIQFEVIYQPDGSVPETSAE